MTAKDRYSHTYEHGGETVRVGVHCSGPTREPRVRWQVGDQRGDRGYVRLSDDEPVIRLEDGETAHLDDGIVSTIPVPQHIGETLNAACEKQGTVTTGTKIGTDPSAFPTEIAGFDRLGWEADRHVMWYWRDARSSPRAYQLEDGQLVFRAQEWANGEMSNQELIDQYGLTTTF